MPDAEETEERLDVAAATATAEDGGDGDGDELRRDDDAAMRGGRCPVGRFSLLSVLLSLL